MNRRRFLAAVCTAAILLLSSSVHAAGPSDTVEVKILEWLTKQTAFGTAPSQLWVSLHGTDPGDTCANELASSGAYARAQLNPDTNNSTNTNWTALGDNGTNKRVRNATAISFATATASWFSGAAIPYLCLRDASTSGTCLYCGTIGGGTGVVVLNGNTLTFAINAVSIQID